MLVRTIAGSLRSSRFRHRIGVFYTQANRYRKDLFGCRNSYHSAELRMTPRVHKCDPRVQRRAEETRIASTPAPTAAAISPAADPEVLIAKDEAATLRRLMRGLSRAPSIRRPSTNRL
jgi:hypothetical protein